MDDREYKIYMYTNSANGKVYIGQTRTSLEYRAQTNGNNYKECRRFYNAIKKYGWDSFTHEILFDCLTLDEANVLEEQCIETYHARDPKYGYNIAFGGLNHKCSDETRALLSQRRKEEYRDKTRNPMYGKKHTPEALKKMSEKKRGANNPMYGKKLTDEAKAKQRHNRKAPILTVEQKAEISRKMKQKEVWRSIARPVGCLEDELSFVSMTEAARHYGVDVTSIRDQLKGKIHTCKGRHFYYIDKNKCNDYPYGSTSEIGTGGSGEAGGLSA